MTRTPAETFPLWDFVLEELDERGQDIDDLWGWVAPSMPLGKLTRMLETSRVDCNVCERLASFFGTSVDLWRNLAMAYSGVDPCNH